jgi:hypothetical protein
VIFLTIFDAYIAVLAEQVLGSKLLQSCCKLNLVDLPVVMHPGIIIANDDK